MFILFPLNYFTQEKPHALKTCNLFTGNEIEEGRGNFKVTQSFHIHIYLNRKQYFFKCEILCPQAVVSGTGAV
jgi:hypothetical protein